MKIATICRACSPKEPYFLFDMALWGVSPKSYRTLSFADLTVSELSGANLKKKKKNLLSSNSVVCKARGTLTLRFTLAHIHARLMTEEINPSLTHPATVF